MRRSSVKRWRRLLALAVPFTVVVAAVPMVLPSIPVFAAPGDTTRVSVASDGTQANGNSFSYSISADGRFVTFDSAANNLTPADTNNSVDVFVRDRLAGTTER